MCCSFPVCLSVLTTLSHSASNSEMVMMLVSAVTPLQLVHSAVSRMHDFQLYGLYQLFGLLLFEAAKRVEPEVDLILVLPVTCHSDHHI